MDYGRSHDTAGSAAINSIFNSTQITNEPGNPDYPFYWSGTTHLKFSGSAYAGVYVAFGRGSGPMDGRSVMDIHGAGCQRSDPKSGNASQYRSWGHGPRAMCNACSTACAWCSTLINKPERAPIP